MSRSIPEIIVSYYIQKSYPDALFNYKGFKWNTGIHGGKSEFDELPAHAPSIIFDLGGVSWLENVYFSA